MLKIITTVCPVTGKHQTRMTEQSFRRMCAMMQEREENSYCREKCRGKVLPQELELIDLKNQQGAEDMGSAKYINGKCHVCGETKSIKSAMGKQVCSYCDGVWRQINKRPESVLEALKEKMGDQWVLYRLPQKAEQVPAEASATDELVAELRAELATAHKQIDYLEEQFDAQVDINKRAEAELAELRAGTVVGELKTDLESRDSILLDLLMRAISGDHPAGIVNAISRLRGQP